MPRGQGHAPLAVRYVYSLSPFQPVCPGPQFRGDGLIAKAFFAQPCNKLLEWPVILMTQLRGVSLFRLLSGHRRYTPKGTRLASCSPTNSATVVPRAWESASNVE
jgi:hypothetical protein